jgi:hypothetical protein
VELWQLTRHPAQLALKLKQRLQSRKLSAGHIICIVLSLRRPAQANSYLGISLAEDHFSIMINEAGRCPIRLLWHCVSFSPGVGDLIITQRT